MARQATKFENHETFGAFGTTPENTEGLAGSERTVIASDKETQRSGEVTVTVFDIAEGNENPLGSALALFGGSDVELAKFAVNAYNDKLVSDAKAHIVDSIVGPEKKLIKTVKRVAKALGVEDTDGMLAKVKQNPAYLNMLLDLAK